MRLPVLTDTFDGPWWTVQVWKMPPGFGPVLPGENNHYLVLGAYKFGPDTTSLVLRGKKEACQSAKGIAGIGGRRSVAHTKIASSKSTTK